MLAFKKILVKTRDGKDVGSEMSEGVEVICVGLSRTGTSSLKAALSILLPGVTYHGMDFLNEINDESSFIFWSAMAEGERRVATQRCHRRSNENNGPTSERSGEQSKKMMLVGGRCVLRQKSLANYRARDG